MGNRASNTKATIKAQRKQSAEFRSENRRIIGMRKASRFSKGESKIAEFLKENGVEFYPEFYFTELKIVGSSKALFFDFYCPSYNLCIELDGEQHYTERFNGQKLPNIKKYDYYKSMFCMKKGISLLRIKYDHFDNIETILCKKFDAISPVSGI